MSDTALGLLVVGLLVLLVVVVGLRDLLGRRRLRHQVDDAAVKRGLAAQEARYGKTTPQAVRDLGPY